MAIVINGNGTVTGISVGGLPDGVVDAGTLATNSVDSAELIDGSIDTAHIGTDQITSAILPAGSAIQVVTASDNTTITLSGTLGVYSTGVSATITPSSTASKIIVIAVLQYHLSSGNHAAIASRILRASTNIHATSFNGYYGAETFNRIQSQTVTVLDSPNTASAVTYYLQGANEAGSTNIGPYVGKLNQYNESSIMLIEIKG